MATITLDRTGSTYANLSAAISAAQTDDNITISGDYEFTDGEVLAIGEKKLTVNISAGANKLIADRKTVTISGSGKTNSSIKFTVGKQLDILANNTTSGKVFTIKDVSAEVLLGNKDYTWCALAVEKGNPTLLLNNASLKVGMADNKSRQYFQFTDNDKRYVSAGTLYYTSNATLSVTNHSELKADYLVHNGTNALTVSDSTVSILGANSVGSVKISSTSYYRAIDRDQTVDGVRYYAWKKLDEENIVYTITLQIINNSTRYYRYENESFVDTGAVNEYIPTNRIENIGSGGIILENSTLEAAVIRNTSRFDAENNKGGIVVTNSTVTVAARELAGVSSLNNTGTIDIKSDSATITLTGLSTYDNETITITVKRNPADSDEDAVYSGTLDVTGDTAVISSYKFTGGMDYYVTIGDGGAVQYTASAPAPRSSFTVNGSVTNTYTADNRAVISVDAYSSFSSNSFVNKYGEFKIVYNPDNASAFSISSFNNSNGILTIDVTKYLETRDTTPVATISGISFSSLSAQGTVKFVDSTGASVSDVYYSLNTYNEIVLGPQMVFVNAKWTDTDQIPTSVTYNNRTYYFSGDNVNALAFGKVQDAIDAASTGSTIVFYSVGGSSDVNDFKFYPQGLVTIDKDLFFESNTSTGGKAVKFDALKISAGCKAEFRTGLYSLEDFLDNEGGTLKIVKKTRFNADLIKNANGMITLDKTSRLVAASIDAGVVEVRAGFVYNDLKWIECPYAAKIGDHATINLVYPRTAFSPSDNQDGVVWETRTIEGKQYDVVVETINPGDQVYAKVVDGQYICYGTAAHHKVDGQPQHPEGDDWDSFYAATEYGGLQFIDDEFDLVRTGESEDDPYRTAAIYVTKNGFRTATLTSDLEEASKTLTVNGTGMAAGNYSCSVTVGENVLNGKFVVDGDGNGSVDFQDELTADSYVIKLADPKYKATAETVDEHVTLSFTAKGLAAQTGYRYSITTSGGVLSGNCSTDEDGIVTIINDELVSDTSYTVVLTKGTTFDAKSQKESDDDHLVTVSTEFNGNPIVYDSFVGALNSIYIQGHTIGKPESGMVVRLQSGTYTEGDFSIVLGETTQSFVGIGTSYNIIVEPDRWQDAEGQWHYDDVSMVLGGTFGGSGTANLMTFYKLKDMTIGDLVVGRNTDTGKEELSVVNFVDIENLTINYRLKPMNAATIRILNSNVTSYRHFSVPGGTLIIENSYVRLVGQTEHGALSTENNSGGSGTVILRNSVFELKDTNAQSLIVNLKINCEFTITGTCTVNGIFMNIDEANGSDTYIAFRDAILDENTDIQAGSKIGAALRFEGYNVLDGSTVEQNGDKDMTIEVGSTLDMSSGASITVGGDVEVSNCGNINLDNSSISAGSFTNEGSLTLSDGAEISLVREQDETGGGSDQMVVEFDEFYDGKDVKVTVKDSNGNVVTLASDTVRPEIVDGKCTAIITKASGIFSNKAKYTVSYEGYFVNAENGVLTAELQSDGSLGITTSDGTPVSIENTGTIYIDLSKTDIPEDPYIVLEGLSGDGDVVVIGGGGEYSNTPIPGGGSGDVPHINLFSPSTETLYVNGEWSNPAVYKKGKNVGSYTYFGYNAFEDNCGLTVRDLTFATDTTKVIYYGGSTYSDWTLPRVVRTITTDGGTFARYSNGDVVKDVKYYAWEKTVEEIVTIVYTQTLAVENSTPTYTWNEGTSRFDQGSAVTAFTLLDSITLTTLETMSTVTLTATFTVSDGSARTVSIVVKDAKGKVIEKQNYSVAASETETYFEDVVFYSSSLSEADASGYTVSIVDNGTTTQLAENDWSVTNVSGDRDTATMGPMTVGASQTVTLSGATMSLKDDGGTKSVTNSGTLKIETGESAKLVIPVAPSVSMRDVKVVVKIGSNEEYHTVQAAAGADSVTVESKSFAPGQEYSVSVTDTKQYSAVGNTLSVDVVSGNARTINVVARNAEGVKFTFTKVAVGEGDTVVHLDPSGALDNTSGSISPNFDVLVDGNGILTLSVTGNVEAQRVDAYIQKTVGDTVYRFDYTFLVAAHSEGSEAAIYTVSTRLSSEGYYYVESLEPDITVTSEVNGISGAYVSAEDVTNSGSIVVASQDTASGVTRRSAKMVLDVDENDNADRWIEVEVGGKLIFELDGVSSGTVENVRVSVNGTLVGTYTATKITSGDDVGKYLIVSDDFAARTTYSVTYDATTQSVKSGDADTSYSLFVAKGASTAELESEHFTVGKEYSGVKIKDAYSTAITAVGEGDTKTLTLTGLSSSDNVIRPSGTILRTLKATVRDGAAVLDTYTITTINADGTAVISDSRLTAGTEYTVEISDVKTVVATAETLAVFDSTGDVVNESGKTIEVTDATFNAGTLDNSGTITITNSQFNVNGAITNVGAITMDIDSLITAGSIDNTNGTPDDPSDDGTITIDATSFDPATTDMKKVIDLDNTSGTISGKALVLSASQAQIDAGIGILYDSVEHDFWVVAADQSTVYVNEAWATDEYGLAHKTGDLIEDSTVGGKKLYYGYNAFGSFTEAYAETLKVNPYTLNGSQQTITAIEVFGPAAGESAKNALLFFGDNGKVLSDLAITVHAPSTPAAAVIPFDDGDYGINISPADGVTLMINSGITIRTTSEEGFDQCSGSVYLNYQRTSGVIGLNGTIDSAREIKIYGRTDVSNTGSLKAASLLWINSGAKTVTVTGTGGSWTSVPQVSAENIMISTGKLEITGSKVASKGLVFDTTTSADDAVVLDSTNTDWTLNNIGTTGADAKGVYKFTGGSIMVTGDASNTINNVSGIHSGEVAVGSGITLELANTPLTVRKGEYEGSTGAILNSGTVKTDLSSLITAESIDNTNGTITIAADGFNGIANGMQKVIDLQADDMYDLVTSATSTVNFTDGGAAAPGYYLAYEHSAYDYWVTDAPQTTLYVKEGWSGNYGDYIETDSVTGVKKYYGYNAFSSFVDALTVASDLTINNANFASGITINVESNIANDVIPAGDGSLNLEFKGAILIVGDHTVTIKGDRYLRLGAATNTTSFVFNPDFVFDYRQVGTVNTGKYGLLLGTSPANSFGSVTMNGTITTGNRFQAITGSLTLNDAVTADTYVYLGSTNMTVAAPIASNVISFVGAAAVNKAATLTTGDSGNIVFMADPGNDVAINGNGEYTASPQVYTGSLELVDGTVSADSTFIKTKDHLLITDDWDWGEEVNVTPILNATDTAWSIGNEIRVGYYSGSIRTTSAARLNFTGSTIDVANAVVNKAHLMTDAGGYLGERNDAPAMIINLTASDMTVGTTLHTGTVVNAGTISLAADNGGNASNLIVYGAIDNSGGLISTDIHSLITAESLDNTSGTITIEAKAFDHENGMRKVISLTTDDEGALLSSTVNFTVNGTPSTAYSLICEQNGDGCDYWVTDSDQTTLYVNGNWASGSYGYGDYIETTTAGVNKYYGYNAAANITEFSETTQAPGQKAKYSAANEVVITAGNYGIASKTYFYSDNTTGVRIRGAVDDANNDVTFNGGRFYLTSAVTDPYADNVAGKTAPLFTLDSNLTLNVSMLNVGNAKDISETTRTGGVADLEIDGTLNGALYVAPYSTVTVNKSGNVDVFAAEDAWLQIRPNAVLTVNGSDGDGARTFGTDEYQFVQDALNFIDGGTVNLNNTKAHLEYIRMDSVGSGEQPLDVQNDILNVTDSVLVFGSKNLAGAASGVVFGSLPHTNTMTVNLSGASVKALSKDFNPLAGMTVNVNNSTVSAAAATNRGTINLGTIGDKKATFTVSGAIDNAGGTINIRNIALLGEATSVITASSIDNTSGTITIDATGFSSGTRKVIDVTTKAGLALDRLTLTNAAEGLRLVQAADGDIFVTNQDQTVLYVDSTYTASSCGGHIYGYNAFSSFAEAVKTAYSLSANTANPVAISVTSATDAAQVYSDFINKQFANNLLIQKSGEGNVTVTVPFSSDGLFLTPAADRNITIAEGLTIATSLSGGYAEDKGAVYLNYNGTSGTVTVNGNITAATGIKIYGESQINGTLTVASNEQNKPANIVLRAGKAAPHATVTFGASATISGADWFRYLSGNVVTNNAAISVKGFKYDNQWTVDSDFDSTPATLTSNGTSWTVGTLETAGAIHAAQFNFNGGSFNVTGTAAASANATDAAEIGSNITVNLTNGASFNVANGTLSNAGTITLDKDSLLTAASIANTGDGKVWIDATGFSGMKKIIDLSTAGDQDAKIVLKPETSAGVTLTFDGEDYWITSAGDSVISVNTDWTDEQYGDEVADGEYYGYNATETIQKAVDLAKDIPGAEIVVTNGAFGDITQLNGIKTEIHEDGTETRFQRAVYGGVKTADMPSETAGEDADNPVNRNIDLKVTGGVFEKFVAGGNCVRMAEDTASYYVTGATQSVNVSGGLFTAGLVGGDRFEKGELHRVGNVTMNISGGTFTYCVAGGMMNVAASTTDSGRAFIDGDVEMKITGGTFTNDCWIYGGGISTGKKTVSDLSTINGCVTITVDAYGVEAADKIVLSHVVAGSHGYGHVTGRMQDGTLLGTKVVFMGDGDDDAAVKFTDDGELWGSSSGDSINPLTGEIIMPPASSPFVAGDRVLSFVGFNGAIDCSAIRAFSKVEIKTRKEDKEGTVLEPVAWIRSAVTLDSENYNLSGVKDWEFDFGSTLSGNFTNDFSGDTLNLVGFTSLAVNASQAILTDLDISSEDPQDVFNGFAPREKEGDPGTILPGLSAIRMDGAEVSDLSFADNAYTFSTANDGSYRLSLITSTESETATTSMVLTRTA